MRQARVVSPPSGRSFQLLDQLFKGQSIRRILLAILILTLLPLAALMAWQGISRLEQERQEQRQRLADAALLTAYSEQNSITRAEGLLKVMAGSPDIVGASPTVCAQRLVAARDALSAYSHFSVIGPDGVIRCAASPRAVGESVTAQPFWEEIRANGAFTITAPVHGRYTGGIVIWAVLPLATAEGAFDGAITASIDLDELRKLLRARQAANNATVAIVDGHGVPIVSSMPLDWARLPISGRAGDTHVIDDSNGRRWAFAEAPLHTGTGKSNTLHLVYAAERPALFGGGQDVLLGYFLLPMIALLIASLAIWVGTNRTILRWISDLRRIAAEVGRGEYHPVPVQEFAGAPAEVRGLAAELRRMSRMIARRDRTLQLGLQHQKALSHELHHRVRNNLQVIASFLALRERAVTDPAAMLALSEARLHVGVLGAAYRLLYDGGDLTSVRLDRLLNAVLPQLRRELKLPVSLALEPAAGQTLLDIDSAIPVALWLLEALMLASARGGGETGITIALGRQGDQLSLSLEAATADIAPPDDQISARMLQGLARQLGGSFEDDREAGKARLALVWKANAPRTGTPPVPRLSSADPAA